MQSIPNDTLTQIQSYLTSNPSALNQITQQWQKAGYDTTPLTSGGVPATQNVSQSQNGIAPVDGVAMPFQGTGNPIQDASQLPQVAVNAVTSFPSFIGNLTKGVWNSLSGIAYGGDTAQQEVQSLKNNPLIRTGVGMVETLGQGLSQAMGNKNADLSQSLQGVLPTSVNNWLSGDAKTAQNFLGYMYAKYLGGFKNGAAAGFDNLEKSVVNDPNGTALDISAILTAGSSLAGAIGKAGEVSDVADISSGASGAGDASKVAESTQPIAQAPNLATKISQGLGTASKWTNPIQPIVSATSFLSTAFGNLLSRAAKSTGDITDAAARLDKAFGTNISESLTQGEKGGNVARLSEGVAASTLGGGAMWRKISASIQPIVQGLQTFGKGFMSSMGVEDPGDLWQSIQTLREKVWDSQSNEFKAQQANFNQFEQKYASVPSSDTQPLIDAIQKEILPGIKKISNSGVTYLKGMLRDINSTIAGVGGDPLSNLMKGGSEDIQALVKSLRDSGQTDDQILSNGTVTRMAEKEGLDLTLPKTTGVTFKDLNTLRIKLGSEISTTANATDRWILGGIKDILDQTLGETMKGVDQVSFDAYNNLTKTFGGVKDIFQNSVFKTFTNMAVDPEKVIDQLFRANSRTTLQNLQGVMNPEDFQQLTGYGLAKKMIDAMKDWNPATDPLNTVVKAFKDNINKVGMTTWKAVLDPETYARLEKAMANNDDFETLIQKGIKGSEALVNGSRTTPLYRFLQHLRNVEKAGSVLLGVGGGAVAADHFIGAASAAYTAIAGILGDIAFPKFVASDMGQKLLGMNFPGLGEALQQTGSTLSQAGGTGGLMGGTQGASIMGKTRMNNQ